MPRTIVRQDTQIRNSDAYTDNLNPATRSDLETTATNIEADLNGLRSVVNKIMINSLGGNWYDDIPSVTNIDGESKQRGISLLNSELDALEVKRVLCRAQILTDVSVNAFENWAVLSVAGSEAPTQVSAIGAGTDRGAVTALAATTGASVAATETLTASANVANNDTVTTGSKTYTFQTALTNVDGNVLIGATASDSLDNLIAAINLGGGAGSLYAAATTANGFVSAAAGAGDTMDVTALLTGTAGNGIATTEVSATLTWGAAVTSGGTNGFDSHELVEVVGVNAVSPKNLVVVRDATTGQIIQSSGRDVYGLLQSESTATSGLAFDDVSGQDRVKISFVRLNATLDDLEVVPIADIAGSSFNYAYVLRDRLEDFPEDCFLPNGNFVDQSTSVDVTRQRAYDNQGASVVTTTVNHTLDLGTATTWELGDVASAPLFQVIEGSGGGTTQLNILTGVDEFDVDAIVNNFNAGISARTGGTRPIDVGVTDGVIESVAGDLRIAASPGGTGELWFDDSNQTGSTWAQTDGIKLSDTTAEWDTFETNFGEVSLLNAINQAANTANALTRAKCVAVVTGGVHAANTNISGTTATVNLDANLCDYSSGTVTFVDDVDIYLNGVLLRNGVDAAANHDVYPGTSAAAGDIRFEFSVKSSGSSPDVITMIVWDPGA